MNGEEIELQKTLKHNKYTNKGLIKSRMVNKEE